MTFWDHLDELKKYLVRIVVVALLFTLVAFCLKEPIFGVILAPQNSDFVTYRAMQTLGLLSADSEFSVSLINTGLASQFLTHMKVSLWVGVLGALPYIIYTLFSFVAPALYEHEKRHASRFVVSGYFMFLLGCLLSYFVIFPFTFRFLGTYQVSTSVDNMINLSSYISTMLSMTMMMGVVFEIPMLCLLFARIGVLSSATMTDYRKHAIVVILIAAAVITPTGDPFTLSLVSLPMWGLYELGLCLVKCVERHKKAPTN